uniref:Protection of telomeres 1 protein n=1 Tax=Tetraselmis sp. GSL018 TaxID=582737 RepID=A0A061RT24_9CHLO
MNPAAGEPSTNNYDYRPLHSIIRGNTSKAYAYAVCTECSAPVRTKGTDWKSTLTLVDSSIMEQVDVSQGVTLILFALNKSDLPLAKPGDILRLHRVTCQVFNGQPQLKGKVGGPSQWCLYDGACGTGTDPISASSTHVSDPVNHEQLLQRARDCSRNYVQTSTYSARHQHQRYLRQICQLGPEECNIDLFGRIAAAYLSESRGDRLTHETPILWIWDGTDCPPVSATASTSADHEARDPPLEPGPPAALALADMPRVGSLLPVLMHRRGTGELPLPARDCLPSEWVKLRNVRIAPDDGGRLTAHFHSHSRWSYAPEPEQAVQDYRRRLERNEVDSWAPRDLAELASRLVPPHGGRPWSSLAGSGRPGKYRCLARVVGHWPADVVQFCSWKPQTEGTSGTAGGWVWTVKLLLEDATARLGVLLWGADAAKFFAGAGLHACDLQANPEVLCRLREAMRCLEGRDRWPPVWIQCCLRSFFRERARPRETVAYRVFDTAISL